MSLTETASRSRVTGMNFRQALGEVIRTERQARGLRMRDVAERGYLSYGHLSEVERGIKEASSLVLDGIATGMSMQTYELILKTAYLMADIEIPDTPEELFFIEAIRQMQSQT